MGILEDALGYWRTQRFNLMKGVSDLESGRKLHSERRDTDWLDVTPDLITQWKEQIGQLDRLIAAYETLS